LLPNPALKEVYDDLVWLYVYTDFSRSENDRTAERIMMRFGVTSWPQHFLVDPESLETLADTGRSVQSFLGAANRTKVQKSRKSGLVEKTQLAEQRAIRLARTKSVKDARKAVDEADIVLRLIALRVLAAKDPRTVVRRAQSLLAVPNDPFRYEVCAVLKDAKATAAAPALEAIVKQPRDSRNPNVLRIRAVQALAECGNSGSVDVIAEHAVTGAYFNGLTGTCIDALVVIARRDKKARAAVADALRRAYPKPPAVSDARATRSCLALAKRVHKARGVKSSFPKTYDEAAWRKLRGR